MIRPALITLAVLALTPLPAVEAVEKQPGGDGSTHAGGEKSNDFEEAARRPPVLGVRARTSSTPSFAVELVALPDAARDEVTLPTRVHRIAVTGLVRTQPFVVLRELPFAAGQVVDAALWQFATTRLWNCGLFNKVEAVLARDPSNGEVVATFAVVENWTLNPLFSFAAGGRAAWVRLGATDSNLLGRFLEFGAQYERFTHYDGFQAWVRDPRFLGRRLDWVVVVDRLVRPRPDFADRRLRLGTEVAGLLWQDRLRLTAKVEALYDVLLPADGGDDAGAPRHGVGLVEFGVRLGRVDALRVRQRGVSLEVRSTAVATDAAPVRGFSQGWLELLALQTFGERWNLAARLQMGAQGEAPDHLRFWLGGLNLVRGYVDNHVRTGRYLLLNAEARWVALDSYWVALVPAAFVDVGLAAPTFGTSLPLLSTGGGVRIVFPWMVRSGLRVDAALPLLADGCPRGALPCIGLSLGVYQFF